MIGIALEQEGIVADPGRNERPSEPAVVIGRLPDFKGLMIDPGPFEERVSDVARI